MKQFVVMSDEVLYCKNGPPGLLVPYYCGIFCWHQLREEAMRPPTPAVAQAAAANRINNSVVFSAQPSKCHLP